MEHLTNKHPVVYYHNHTMQNLHGHLVLCSIIKGLHKISTFWKVCNHTKASWTVQSV